MHLVDLIREGFHAAVRQGIGPWPGLESERLFEQPSFIVVGSPSSARRLAGAQPEALAREPLLGDNDLWKDWFAAADQQVQIPMSGAVDSLNVSVATGIALYAVTHDRPGDLGEDESRVLRARFLLESVREPDLVIERYLRDHPAHS